MSVINKLRNNINAIVLSRKLRKMHPGIHKSARFQEPSNITIGDNCNIGENSYLLCWKKYRHGPVDQDLNGKIIIGNNFNATRNLTIQSCNEITIGNDVLIASNVFICDYNHGINDIENPYLNNYLSLSQVVIEDGVWIGQGAFILPGVKIGKKAIVGAGSVVTKNVPEYCIAAGNPARIVKRYNTGSGKWECEDSSAKSKR